jgi:hypothetical protein
MHSFIKCLKGILQHIKKYSISRYTFQTGRRGGHTAGRGGRTAGRGAGRQRSARVRSLGQTDLEVLDNFVSMEVCDVEAIKRPNDHYWKRTTEHTYEERASPFLAFDKEFDFAATYSVEPMHTVFHGAVKGFFNHALFNPRFHRFMLAGKKIKMCN